LSLFKANLRVNGLFLGYGIIRDWVCFSKNFWRRFFRIRWQGVVGVIINGFEQDV